MPYYINTGLFAGVKSKIPTPDSEAASFIIIKAIEHYIKMVAIPGYICRLSRFVQALLSINMFDWFAGDVLSIYKTIEHFTGRKI